jgi:TolB-like protein/Tfp pilus assembly protein PilF
MFGAVTLFLLVMGRWPMHQSIESVAVLPFSNTEADPELEYLADGITENIISNLSQLSQLRVMSRNSVFRYKGRDVEPQTVGRELGVQAVLAGRILSRGDQLAVSLELIDVNDNRQLWGDQYTRKPVDLLYLQAEISREVSDKLRLQLSGRDQQQLAKSPTTNAEAYQLFLKARFFQNQATEEGFQKAIEYYQQALDKDPNYALAYVGMADVHIALGTDSVAPREAMPKARKYAMRALELDEELAQAHTSLGVIYLAYDWDWPAAEREFRRDLALSPSNVESFSCSLHWEDSMGRNDEAIASIKRALALDPSSLPANLELGCASYYGRHYDQSIKQVREALKMYPDHPYLTALIGRSYGQKKMYSEAIAELTKAQTFSGDWPPILAELGYAFGASGKKAEAYETIEKLRRQATHRFVDPYLIAMIHVSMGDKEQAFAELDKAIAERSGWLPWLKLEPKWDSLHADPRFTVLTRRVGLTP